MDDADIQRKITNMFIRTLVIVAYITAVKRFYFGHTVFVCMALYCSQDFVLGCWISCDHAITGISRYPSCNSILVRLSLRGRVTGPKGHGPKGQWSEGLGLGLGLGAECLHKLNETPKSRTSTLFMHGVPVLPFRYGTYVCNNNRRTSDPSDQWSVAISAAIPKNGDGSLVRRVTSPKGHWSEKSLWTAWNSKFETLDSLPCRDTSILEQ